MNPFYLGRIYDPAQGKTLDQPLNFDPNDLTTHAVVTGMTGSGKTGLCISLLEEAALDGIPAIAIDPKGDLTNLLLHFPTLAPADFKPWMDADAARRQGKSVDDVAAETATAWKAGLAQWGITPERVEALQKAADFAIYTPGSDAGQQVSILASLKAPPIPWEGNRELLREEIASTVTALLTLIGLGNIDPMRSREHILLSNIFENAWSQAKDLDLTELIMQTQAPPFAKLGVFPVETFFPEKDRFDLALQLNNFLAAPSFQTWLEGQALDIPSLLYTAGGRPRHSVFYLAHLNNTERMFFITLLFTAIETWMRTQSGSSGLRALVYFDEIVGYLPPVNNPPSKVIILRMLKQARAFGVGLLLASQNPVDVDYKALSNTGTWMIGKLQTDQDKQRLLDGLLSADGSLERSSFDRLISSLGKRVFVLHDIHRGAPELFQTRWTMNYLAGPLTRAQIPALNRLGNTVTAPPAAAADATSPQPTAAAAPASTSTVQPAAPLPPAASPASAKPAPSAEISPATQISTSRPVVPADVSEYFMPNNRSLAAALQVSGRTLPPGTPPATYLYHPALVAQARIRYLARKYNFDHEQARTVLTPSLDRRGVVRWDDFATKALDEKTVQLNGLPQAGFTSLQAPLDDPKILLSLQKDFVDWAYRTSQVKLRYNAALNVSAGPDTTTAEFRELCSQAARAGRDDELAKINASFDAKKSGLQDKLAHAQRDHEQKQEVLSQRKMEEVGTGLENVIGLFTRSRRRITTSLTKHRLTEQAKAAADEAGAVLNELQKQAASLDQAGQQALSEAGERWAHQVDDASEVPLTPLRKDVFLDLFGVIWLPFYVLHGGSEVIELAAYE